MMVEAADDPAGDPLDAYFAENMVRIREANGLSRSEFVTRLRQSGWKNAHPTTISRIENKERPVRLSEAAHIASVLGEDVRHLMTEPRRAGIESELDKATQKITKTFDQMIAACWTLIVHRNMLPRNINEYRAVAEREDDDRMRRKADSAEFIYKNMKPETAVEQSKAAFQDPKTILYADDVVERYGAASLVRGDDSKA